MSQKMLCPVCNSHTSSVYNRVRDGEPCPHCGAPADLVMQVTSLRERKADENLVKQLSDQGVRIAQLERENRKLLKALSMVRVGIDIADTDTADRQFDEDL